MQRITLKSVGAYAKQHNIIEDFLYLELVEHNHKAAFVLRYLVAQTGMDRAANNANFSFYLFREQVASLFNMSTSTFDRMRSRFKTIGIIFNNGVAPGTNTQCLWVHFDRAVFWQSVDKAVESLKFGLQVVKMNRHSSSKCEDTVHQNDERNELPNHSPLSSPKREIFEYPSDLAGLKFYEQQIGESIEPFVDQLRDEIKRLGELRVIAKAKTCTNGESWQYLLKSLAKLNENAPEVEKQKASQGDEWQASEYAQKDDPAEEHGELFAPAHLDDDNTGETPAIQLPAVSADDQYYFDMGMEQLELQFDRATFDTWIKPARLTAICHESNTMTFEVPNQYAQNMLQNRLYRNLRRVFSDTWSKNMELVFTLGSREMRLPTYEGLKTGHVSACPA